MDERLKERLANLLRAVPVAIPYAGHALSHYLSEQQIRDLSELVLELRKLNDAQHSELIYALGDLGQKFQALEEILLASSDTPCDSKITVIVPCGGSGGSLFPMTQVMPKSLVLIDRKPIIQHIIDALALHQDIFAKVIVTTGAYHSAIETSLAQGGYGDFVSCVNQNTRSVPHSLLEIEPKIETSRFLLHYNDILLPNIEWPLIDETYKLNKRHYDQIGTLLCSNYYPLFIGIISEGKPGLLGDFEEKPERFPNDRLANTAVSIFDKKMIQKYCRAEDNSLFVETIRRIKESNENVCLQRIDQWFHVQDWNSLYRLQHEQKFIGIQGSRKKRAR